MEREARRPEGGRPKGGKVYLVGAGPGDDSLITVRGRRVLGEADVVVYDALVHPRLLEACAPGCERIYVGKRGGGRSTPQQEINRLLVEKAAEGRVVARLKGGDPFVFGRGGEEALELAERGIPFEVVPGVTAATAAAAYAGIPLTHRGLASTAVLITGHEDPAKGSSSVDWAKLGGAGTLAVYMGVGNLPEICSRLLEAGRAASTPVALIRWGTLRRQRTLTGTLADIAERAAEVDFAPPALIVIGEVVGLRERLRWFDRAPLFGKRVVVTRGRSPRSRLAELLEAEGVEVRELPTIEIEPVPDLSELDRRLDRLPGYDWVVFTSPQAVSIFFERALDRGIDARRLGACRIGVIGSGTAERLREYGLIADLVPERYTSEGALEAFRARWLRGGRDKGVGEKAPAQARRRVLYPASEIARDVLPEGLRSMGAEVDQVAIYRNRTPEYTAEQVDAVLGDEPELVTFTSSSTVSHLVDILRSCGREGAIARIRGCSIGPVTSEAARRLGVTIACEAESQTVDDLARTVAAYLREAHGTNR